ncbi:MAG: nucleotide sugar dehydrogenase [Promethearchaeota archaeon]
MDFGDIRKKIDEKNLIIAVFGLGRIGLPTAVEFASHGYNTIGVDINEKLIEDLKKSNTFVDEPGLKELLEKSNNTRKIEFTTNGEYAVKNSDIIIICLPTPINEDMGPDYSSIEIVSHLIGKHIKKNQIIIVESSVSPTTIEKLVVPIIEDESAKRVNDYFAVSSCPERADPGKIIQNFDTVPRIVGGSTKEVTEVIAALYSNITHAKILKVSNPNTANAIKLTENIFRDVNIALVNELAVLYEMLGVNIKEVIEGCSTKYNFQPHYPGPGVGGPCLPANPYYIIKDAQKVNYIPFLIRVAREVNDRMPEHVTELIIKALNEDKKSVNGSRIAILGISYKANVRDIQISPSIKVIELLQQLGADLKIFDPYYKGEEVLNFKVEESIDDTIENADAIAILTDHKEFKDLDFEKLKNKMNSLILVDSRNIYKKEALPKGTIYCGVGQTLQKI